jgi:hypothetical protein
MKTQQRPRVAFLCGITADIQQARRLAVGEPIKIPQRDDFAVAFGETCQCAPYLPG